MDPNPDGPLIPGICPPAIIEELVEDKLTVPKGKGAIPERYDKLITSLRTAYANELSLDKQQTSYSDLLDGLRLALKAYSFE